MNQKRRRGKIGTAVLSVCMVLCLAVTVFGNYLLLRDSLCESGARYVPSYEKIDLSDLIKKEIWTDEDYDTIYRQTGLSRAGADRTARNELAAFQDAFFFQGQIRHEYLTPITPHDYQLDPDTGGSFLAPMVPLEAGDIILTSTTHLFGWRHGHAALVVDGVQGLTLESTSIGEPSSVSHGLQWFRKSTNFLVLRLKDKTEEERAEIAARAEEELTGLEYNVFVGFFMPKDQCANGRKPTSTHCAHLVWQAFLNAGYDLDPTGGPLVTPQDIANSPLVEVVQTYGFDPDTLWK